MQHHYRLYLVNQALRDLLTGQQDSFISLVKGDISTIDGIFSGADSKHPSYWITTRELRVNKHSAVDIMVGEIEITYNSLDRFTFD